jgi:hypothetical protein
MCSMTRKDEHKSQAHCSVLISTGVFLGWICYSVMELLATVRWQILLRIQAISNNGCGPVRS